MRAMSLVSSEGDNEQNEMRSLQEKLDSTVTLVAQLSGQLAELKEQVEWHFWPFYMLWWRKAVGLSTVVVLALRKKREKKKSKVTSCLAVHCRTDYSTWTDADLETLFT